VAIRDRARQEWNDMTHSSILDNADILDRTGHLAADLDGAQRPVDLAATERAAADFVTSALLGTLRSDPRSRAEFFALAGVPTSPSRS
jgi:hypothetical protein